MGAGSKDPEGTTSLQTSTAITAPARALASIERILDDYYPRGADGKRRLPGRSMLDLAQLKRWTPA
jgi:hypothetical protein